MAIDIFDFPSVSKEQWLEKIQKDLKGASFKDTLTFQLPGGVVLNAVNHEDDLDISDITPGVAPYLRSNKSKSNTYNKRQQFNLDADDCNKQLLDALNNNVNAVLISGQSFDQGLKGVEPNWIEVAYNGQDIDGFIDYCNAHGKTNFYVEHDPFFSGDHTYINRAAQFKKQYKEACFLSVDAVNIANGGGSAVTELLYALSAGHDMLVGLMEAGLTIDEASANMVFNFGLGPIFYVETAKLRAFRTLWSTVIKQYNPVHECSFNANIQAITATWNKPDSGKDINLLRVTTEALSAIAAGADTVQVNPNNLTSNTEQFNRRMAVNALNLLSEESYMELVVDPAGGSYVIESLTRQLIDLSWEAFKAIESTGGLSKNKTIVNSRMLEERQELISQIASGDVVLIGTNKYRKDGNFDMSEISFNEFQVK